MTPSLSTLFLTIWQITWLPRVELSRILSTGSQWSKSNATLTQVHYLSFPKQKIKGILKCIQWFNRSQINLLFNWLVIKSIFMTRCSSEVEWQKSTWDRKLNFVKFSWMSGFQTCCKLEITQSVVFQYLLFLNTYVNLRCKICHVFISVRFVWLDRLRSLEV